MHPEIARRLALAERIAPAYAANPHVAAVLLAGSVARGTADEFSDIEVDIFWMAAPDMAARLAPIEALGARLMYQDADANEWADGFSIGGVKVDTSQFLVGTVECWLDDVTERADPEVEKQLLLAAIQHGQPLVGAALFERWRERAAAYPAALARAIVAENLAFRPRFFLEMLAARDDLLIFYRAVAEVEARIMNIMLALNRQYVGHPLHKWLEWQCAQLPIAPPNLARRLKQVLRDDPRVAADELHALIEDTFALAEQHLPDLDTREARAEFALRRNG